ncbi:hypothetical protein [Desulfonatronospira sp.]|uniref:hypothetical protein n=1 Tax=Desulfonatronospira sp. TaxID=1962951 RepID=UPI0025B841C7|nr:hypothetical protein [Desulfonatronospira sp.]
MDTVLESLRRISFGKRHDKVSPHKFALLLALAQLYENNPDRENKFTIQTDNLEQLFKSNFQRLDSEYNHNLATIDHPFFYLKNDGFWFLVVKPGCKDRYSVIESSKDMRFTKKRLLELVDYAYFSAKFDQCLRTRKCRNDFCREIIKLFGDHRNEIKLKFSNLHDYTNCDGISEPKLRHEKETPFNKFVTYLNSLQRTNAKNENSLAESQACNPLFAEIHVPQPIAKHIVHDLSSQKGRHVILTGHAGDGKSTVALEVFKQLMGIPAKEALSGYLSERVDIPDRPITLVKDLSERHRDQDNELLQELLAQDRRFLLVSNTGTLLDFFKSQASSLKVDEVSLESQVLTAISQPSGEGSLVLGEVSFHVFNMALMDNLPVARQIFEKIVTSNLWDDCTHRKCRPQCPICLNIDLLKHHQGRVLERIFLAYRRMYEYGTRLTIRQLTEHIAYMVTSGLEEADIRTMHERQDNIGSEYMFFNRFFGDNGRADDPAAQQMHTVREIKRQEFGGRLLPAWERKLWLRSHGSKIPIGVAGYSQQFDRLRELGSRGGVHAREQVRRILYFLYDFSTDDHSYLANYLNSPAILRWSGWQTAGAKLQESERVKLRQQVFHVLQEHLTGVRLPEISSHHRDDQRLYVTLSRRRNEVRQSAQVVLAYVDWNTATNLSLDIRPNVTGNYRAELVLKGQAPIEGVDLPLTLPFLDYVLMRHFGELGEVLQAAYVERLERYKAQIQEGAGSAGESVMLVRLKTDHTFRRQHYTLHNNRLEVSDV